MGKDWGMIKYAINAPIASPVNYFKYGSGFAAVWSAFEVVDSGSGQLIDVYLAYLSMKYLPPSGLKDVALPLLFASAVSAIKWRANVRTLLHPIIVCFYYTL